MSDAVQLILRANKLMNVEQLELVRDMVAATRANALEEAAKVAEECAPVSQDTWSTELAERCDMIAAAIRALVKEQQ